MPADSQHCQINPGEAPLPLPEKLRIAQAAFSRYYTRCFWFMREDLQLGPENLDSIIRGLRAHGDREAFLIAAQLCR